jgi:hypothetical protein
MKSFGRLFSKRQKNEQKSDDVFTYDTFPPDFRTKVIYLLNDTLGNPHQSLSGNYIVAKYKEICDFLCREYGVFSLVENHRTDPRQQVLQFFYECDEHEKVIDVIEITFNAIYQQIEMQEREKQLYEKQQQTQDTSGGAPVFPGLFATVNLPNLDTKIQPKDAIERLNELFLEHHIGYQFESGQINRIDSALMHSEVVKPVLSLLSDSDYSGANEEFLRAHTHYRHKRYKECLNECLKAFESTMKTICSKHHWTFDKDKDTASKLIAICLQHDLIPRHMQSEFTALRTSLESGIPPVRNRLAGHGQGSQVISIPDYVPRYLLHLTATTILFLFDAERDLP